MNRNERLVLGIIISLLAFFIVLYTLSMSRYPNWMYQVIFEGYHENYNMVEELYYGIPYIGPELSTIKMISIHYISFTISVIVFMKVHSMKNYKLDIRRYKWSKYTAIMSYVFTALAMSNEDCIINLDNIIRNLFNDTVAVYIQLGPHQLIIISAVFASLSLWYIQGSYMNRSPSDMD